MDYVQNLNHTFFEISEILKHMPIEYNEKIPSKLKKIINDKKVNNGFIYNNEEPLEKQNILHDTRVFLSILYRIYWCSDENKKGKF